MNLRKTLLLVLMFNLLGLTVELFFLEHHEDFWQILPIGICFLNLLLIVWFFLSKTLYSRLGVKFSMIGTMVVGLIGCYLHIRGNMEFELEMYPSMGFSELIVESLMGATPSLAPGIMTGLGLFGLVAVLKNENE